MKILFACLMQRIGAHVGRIWCVIKAARLQWGQTVLALSGVLGISGQNATKKILNNRKRAVHRKERPIGNLETEREREEIYHRDWWGRGGKVRGCRLCHDGIYIGRVIFLRVLLPLPLWSSWKPCDPQAPLPFLSPQPMNDDRSFNHASLEKENFTSNEKKKEKDFLGKPFWKELIGWNIFSSTLRR